MATYSKDPPSPCSLLYTTLRLCSQREVPSISQPLESELSHVPFFGQWGVGVGKGPCSGACSGHPFSLSPPPAASTGCTTPGETRPDCRPTLMREGVSLQDVDLGVLSYATEVTHGKPSSRTYRAHVLEELASLPAVPHISLERPEALPRLPRPGGSVCLK